MNGSRMEAVAPTKEAYKRTAGTGADGSTVIECPKGNLGS